MDNLSLTDKIKKAALKALLYEVVITPKPGLVDRINNGSHNDMDIFTFIDSALALESYFFDCAKIVLNNENEDFNQVFLLLRDRGKQADLDMFSATGGINTHKGAIFSLGLMSAAAAYSFRHGKRFNYISICNYVGKLTDTIFDLDFKDRQAENQTSGLAYYHSHGITGIRGEVKSGLPTIRNHSYPYLVKLIESGATLNDAAVNVLLKIIINCNDTNLLSRGGLEGINYAKQMAKETLEAGGILNKDGMIKLQKMDEVFISKRLSPGGAADLLSCTLMLFFLNDSVDTKTVDVDKF
ncbi:MAG: 2-(5''-triphosphoribosyl)-3'-dephosphocoenzyme-A synthase [Clostridiales bacterium 38_11]|nr:MAG: 2-(5''-triphosphoribosyl)-3'-dephosphocoenzyme-A synthase [Clostridiales bacterium 38_11]HBH12027.1 triphosphoribosyl-dephospho-CoA synthase CitG [Clostridiales bacterium]